MKELSKKVCKTCGQEKPFSDFYQDRGKPRSNCKRCFYDSQDKQKKCENQKLYYQKNKENRKEYNKEYYDKNKVKLINYQKEYKKTNEKKMREYFRLNHHKRKTSLEYRIKRACRARISAALKNNAKKASLTSDLIGCSVSKLKEHLEKQFKQGMSWENYGDWHIDHIIPCAIFDLTKPEQQRKCFHYLNLQPLWAKENCSKGAKNVSR